MSLALERVFSCRTSGSNFCARVQEQTVSECAAATQSLPACLHVCLSVCLPACTHLRNLHDNLRFEEEVARFALSPGEFRIDIELQHVTGDGRDAH